MKKIILESYGFQDRFKHHNLIQDQLINFINKAANDFDCHPKDKIDYLDWQKSTDMDREWVRFIKPLLEKHFLKCIKNLKLNTVHIRNLWFQKYKKNGVHNWHIHSNNYTGVYYLQFPKGATKTQLVNKQKILEIDAKEGDIIIFPSFVVHRSPKITEDIEKIIISFNLDFDTLEEDYKV
jgi:hypothetical protein|tara:strand:+ start:8074 stop:8613 length:540 start_codon:yes stop_codon:yes gene_type:complete